MVNKITQIKIIHGDYPLVNIQKAIEIGHLV